MLLALPVQIGRGQDRSVLVEEIGVYRDTLDARLSSPFQLRALVLPGSEVILLDHARLDTSAYRLNYRHGLLWIDETVQGDTLFAVYRTLPFNLQAVYRRRVAVAATDSSGGATVVREEAREAGGFDPFAGTRLERSGSISRGILAGNNRDVSVESGLRMQLAGEVAEGVKVQAVLTDENTPILPEGTTQRIDEFDRVFIQLETRQGLAQLGDFELGLGGSEFARFNRKLQGITVQGAAPSFGSEVFGGAQVTVAGATARGIFRTQDLQPLDGVQGPYRLEGQQGELFILVIPASERVYLDGQLLTRGETNDYTIDYALGEITFTPTRLITSDRRLTVEFQYRTNEFTRTLVASQAEIQFFPRENGTARARFGVSFLREADGQQFSQEFGFTSADSLLLTQIGDGLAARDGAEPVLFDAEAPFVQYTRRPHPSNAEDSIFVALTSLPADSVQVYRVRFTHVGQGQGRYRREGRAVNGIRYEFAGEGLGSYEPVRLLPKPKQQRLVDLHGAVQPLPGVELFGEWAGSLNDENRLSDLGSADDRGHAYLGGLRLQPTQLTLGQLDLAKLSAEYRRRFTGDHFATFDRTRPVEFARQWNLSTQRRPAGGSLVQSGDETIDEGFVQLDWSAFSSLRGELGRLDQEDAFRGTRRALEVESGEEGWPRVDYRVEYVTSRDSLTNEDGSWLRQLGVLQKPLWQSKLVPKVEVEQERRRQRVIGTDSLSRQSLAFIEVRPGLFWRTNMLEAGAEVEFRRQEDWADGVLRPSAKAWTTQTHVNFRPGSSFNTEATVGYRVQRFNGFFRETQRRENSESVVIRWNSRWQPFARALDLNWFYEALTERTPTLQEIYVKVGPELGQFVWEDFNGDGIVQLEEFVPERTPDEGNYVQTFIPSDSLTAVIGVTAQVRLELDPSRTWRGPQTGLKKILTNVSTRTTLLIEEKNRDEDLAQIYLLNLSRFRDPQNTLNGRLRIAQDVYFFKGHRRYGLDVSFNQLRGLSELAAGEEARFLNSWRVTAQMRPSPKWSLKLRTALEQNRVESDSLATRRYDIESASVEPEVTFNASRSLQLTGGASLARKTDAIGDRQARVLRFPVEARYTLVRRLQAFVLAEVADVRLDGEAVGLAQFELTEGRGPGTSYLWSLNGSYALTQYLRATFSYNGRAPADAPVIHTVRMQLSATF